VFAALLLALAQPPQPDATALIDRGLDREKAGDLDGAIAAYDEAIRLRPSSARAFLWRGWTWKRKRDYDRALADLDRAIEFDPLNAKAFGYRGEVWVVKKDYPRALADFDEAMRLNPTDLQLYLVRGSCRSYAGDRAGAEADFAHYISIRPADPKGYRHRGDRRYDAREYDRAIPDFTEVLRLDPGDAATHMYRAECYRMTGDHAAAVQGCTDVIRLDPDLVRAHELRAWLRATSPDPTVRDGAAAVADARRACELSRWESGPCIDTLAAAEAECGRFDEAVRYSHQALAVAGFAQTEYAAGTRDRLTLYQEGKAFRDGANAEEPAAARGFGGLTKRDVPKLAAKVAAGVVLLLLVAFRLWRLGVWPSARRTPPAVADHPPTQPGP
jgi:tetratricopeptide (TPR) repeat protein